MLNTKRPSDMYAFTAEEVSILSSVVFVVVTLSELSSLLHGAQLLGLTPLHKNIGKVFGEGILLGRLLSCSIGDIRRSTDLQMR